MAVLLLFAGCTSPDDSSQSADDSEAGDAVPDSTGNETVEAPTGNETAEPAGENATSDPAINETTAPPAPAQEDGTFGGALTPLASSGSHTWAIQAGHPAIVVSWEGTHQVDGNFDVSLQAPDGTEAATVTGLSGSIKIANPAAGDWVLSIELTGVDGDYDGTWCAGDC